MPDTIIAAIIAHNNALLSSGSLAHTPSRVLTMFCSLPVRLADAGCMLMIQHRMHAIPGTEGAGGAPAVTPPLVVSLLVGAPLGGPSACTLGMLQALQACRKGHSCSSWAAFWRALAACKLPAAPDIPRHEPTRRDPTWPLLLPTKAAGARSTSIEADRRMQTCIRLFPGAWNTAANAVGSDQMSRPWPCAADGN